MIFDERMMTLKLIEFFGPSNSGKTEAIVETVRKLKEHGHSVATVKSTKGDLNYEEGSKDSVKELNAGADLSIALGKSESVFHYPQRLSMIDILARLNYDYVIVEGETGFPMPKVLFVRSDEGIERLDPLTVAVVGEEDTILDLEDVVKIKRGSFNEIYKIVENKALPPLPGDDCGHCKMTCSQMMEKIIKGEKTYKNCVKLAKKGVELEINGEKIPMLPFVSSIMKDVNVGILKNLKGISSGQVKVEFELKE